MGASVGLRSDGLLLLDIDAEDEAQADEIDKLAVEVLGPSPCRVGRWPKRLLVYRLGEPYAWKKLVFATPHGVQNKIEAPLQAVAAGIHPATRQPYKWSRPLVALDDLTVVSADQLSDFRDQLLTILPDAIASDIRSSSGPPGYFTPAQGIDRELMRRRLDWAPEMLPGDPPLSGDWRIPSSALERDLEEALVLYPDGIFDFGTERRHTPLSLIREFGEVNAADQISFGGSPDYGPRCRESFAVIGESDAVRRPSEAQVARWLCGRLTGQSMPPFPDDADWESCLPGVALALGFDWQAIRNAAHFRWLETEDGGSIIEAAGRWGREEVSANLDLIRALELCSPAVADLLIFGWEFSGALDFGVGDRDVSRDSSRPSPGEIIAQVAPAKAALGEEWPEPRDIFGDPGSDRCLDPPLDAIPEVLARAGRDMAERIGAPTAFVIGGMLGVVSAAIAAKFKIQPKVHDTAWTEPAFLWFAIVEDPGGKKSPVIGEVTRPLSSLDSERVKHDLPLHEQWQQRKSARRKDSPPAGPEPRVRRHVVEGFTMEGLVPVLKQNPGVLIRQDELTQLIGALDAYKSNKGSDRPLLLSLIDGRETRFERASRGLTYIPTWGASVVGGIQPRRVAEMASSLDSDGLLQRFIPIMGDGIRREMVDRPPDRGALDAYELFVRAVASSEPVYPAPIRLSAEAHEVWKDLSRRVERLAALPDLSDAWKGHLGKWPGFSARVLLVLHVADVWTATQGAPQARLVSAETAGAAARVVEWLLSHSIRFYERCVGAGQAVEDARWIADYLLASQQGDRLTRRDVGQARHELRSRPDRVSGAMLFLENSGWCEPIREARSDRFGPTRWLISPRIHEAFSGRTDQARTRRAQVRDLIAASVAERRRISSGERP